MPIFSIKRRTNIYCYCIDCHSPIPHLFLASVHFPQDKCAADFNGSHNDYLIGSPGENLCLVLVICEPYLHPDGAGVLRILFYVITSYNYVLYNRVHTIDSYLGESCSLPITLHSLHTVIAPNPQPRSLITYTHNQQQC